MMKHALIWSCCLAALVEATSQGVLETHSKWDAPTTSLIAGSENSRVDSAIEGETPPTYHLFESKREKAGFTASGEFIYWKTMGSSWPYATLASVNAPVQGIYERESVREVDFNYDPGFRIGIGYQFDYGWNFNIDWTHFFTDAKAQQTPNSAFSYVETVWTFFAGRASSIKAHQFVHYDRLDFLFAKELFLGKRFEMSSYFGPLYVHLHQRLNLITKQAFDNGNRGVTTTHLTNNFDGGGAEIGLKATYGPLAWLNIYGDGSIALAYGKFKIGNNTRALITPTQMEVPLHESQNQKGVVPGFNLKAGFEGNWPLGKGGTQLVTRLGYEFEIWPDQLRMYRLLPISLDAIILLLGSGNLGFQGLNIGLELRF